MNKKTLLIDADTIMFLVGWGVKNLSLEDPDSYGIVVKETDAFIHKMMQATSVTDYLGFLGDNQPTFRNALYPEYKDKRGTVMPEWFVWRDVIKQRLITYWKFEVVHGIEAEDAVSMLVWEYRSLSQDYTIAHVDKDLDQLAGEHYNYQKDVLSTITVNTAYDNLFRQVLTGDTTDNIKGLPKVGKVGATKLITGTQNYSEVITATILAYIEKLGEEQGIEEFYKNYRLVKLLEAPLPGFDLKQSPNPYPLEPFVQTIHTTKKEQQDAKADQIADLFNTAINNIKN